MSKIPIILLFVTLGISAFVLKEQGVVFNPVPQNSISTGEHLEYKVNFGIFTVGKADMMIYPEYYKINNRDCYKVDVNGRTTGVVNWLADVNDNWGAYVDTEALVPHISWRNIQEGKYIKKEVVNFDHSKDQVEAKVVNNKTGEFKEPKYYDAPNNVRDLIGGFLFVRSIDYSNLAEGEEVGMHAFFEDTVYNFQVRYLGKEVVKTKAGKFKAVKLQPLMPNNEVFNGRHSISLWLSDDKNKIPLKAEASMFIGNARVELVDYKGLKNESSRIDKN